MAQESKIKEATEKLEKIVDKMHKINNGNEQELESIGREVVDLGKGIKKVGNEIGGAEQVGNRRMLQLNAEEAESCGDDK